MNFVTSLHEPNFKIYLSVLFRHYCSWRGFGSYPPELFLCKGFCNGFLPLFHQANRKGNKKPDSGRTLDRTSFTQGEQIQRAGSDFTVSTSDHKGFSGFIVLGVTWGKLTALTLTCAWLWASSRFVGYRPCIVKSLKSIIL